MLKLVSGDKRPNARKYVVHCTTLLIFDHEPTDDDIADALDFASNNEDQEWSVSEPIEVYNGSLP
jgi:hypothetical protein